MEKKLGDLEISKDFQEFIEDDLLVSYGFSSFYPSAQIDMNSSWLKIETTHPFSNYMNESICNLFNKEEDGMS